MGFLERAIRRGIRDGVSKAVGNAIGKAIEPTVTNLSNQAAEKIDQGAQRLNQSAAGYTQETTTAFAGLEGALGNLERATQNYATKAAQNLKQCPACDSMVSSDKSFCPHCGAKLPEQTVAQGAVCTSCGKQNSIGTKFCEACGAKLPAAIAEEQAAAAKDSAVLLEWDQKLPQYPKWNCGGSYYHIEPYDVNQFAFSASFEGDHFAATQAVQQYRQLLLQNGFTQAGQYPSQEHLYKMINGACFHVDTEHCFEGDPDCPSIYFSQDEPTGGFYYVKPEPKKKTSFRDLLGL